MAIYRCKEPFRTNVNGAKRVVPAGELVEDTDPVFKGREHLFEAVDTYVSRREAGVERTTAEPGEKRSVSRPQAAKTAAAKTAEPKDTTKKPEGGTQAKVGPTKSTDGGTS